MLIGNNNLIQTLTRLLFVLSALLIFQTQTFGQNGLSGRIVDTSNAPVPGATVVLYAGDSMKGYAISSEDGSFKISTSDYKSDWRLIVTCLGYRKEEAPLESFLETRLFTLAEQTLSLKAASVTGKVVESRGDTVSYTAGAFKDGSERSLGDLLSKLPGITVSASGGVYHNGKPINKFYIEGMDLMGSGYGVVTRNLSPDVVAEVEVLQRHQPIRALMGLSQSDRSAVNIVLKETARNTWMFNADALAGAPEFPLFDASLLLSRFAKKSQDLYLLKGNDVGIDIKRELMEQDYLGRTGTFTVSGSGYESDLTSRLNPSTITAPVPKEYWYDNLSVMGSFNHLKKVNDDLQIRSSMSVASESLSQSSLSSELISFTDGSSLSIDERKTLDESSHYLRGKVSAEKNSAKTYLYDELTFYGLMRHAVSGLDSRSSVYDQDYSLPSVKIQNSLDLKSRTKEGRAASFKSTTGFILNNHSAHYTGPSMDVVQDFSQKTFNSANTYSSSVRLRDLTVSLEAGLNLKYLGLDSNVKGESGLPTMEGAEMSFFSLNPLVRASSRYVLGRTELSLSLPFSYNVVSGGGDMKAVAYPTYSPLLSASRTFSQYLKMRASASYMLSKSGIETLFSVPLMTDYRTLSQPDSLATSRRLNLSAVLEYSNTPDMLFANLSADMGTHSSDRMPTAYYSEGYTYSGYMTSPVSDRTYSVRGKVNKYLGAKSFVVELSGGWFRDEQNTCLQGVTQSFMTDSYNSDFSVRLSPVSWFSAETKASYTVRNTHGTSSVKSQSITLNGMLLLKPVKKLSWKTDMDWMREKVPGVTSTNKPLLKTELNWKLSKMTLVASCRNLLDVKEFRREYVTTYKTDSFTMDLAGRQFLLGLRMSY